MREKRRYVRTNGLVLVNYRIPSLQLEGKSSAFEISVGGVRIAVDKVLENDVLVEMEIYLPGNSQPILTKGKTIWAKQYAEKKDAPAQSPKTYFYSGIKFTAIDKNSQERISDYVHRKLHQPKE